MNFYVIEDHHHELIAEGPFDTYDKAVDYAGPDDIIVVQTYPVNQYGAPKYPFPISGDNTDDK